MKHRIALVIYSVLVVLFAVLTWVGIRAKSATLDEPLHAVSAFALVKDGRLIDLDTPMLWKYWAMIAEPDDALALDYESDLYKTAERDQLSSPFARSTYIAAGPERADAFLRRARAAMLVLGVLLCVTIIAWAGELAGPMGAVVAAALACLDPNLIANAPLMKSDIPLTLTFALAGYGLWKCGRAATIPAILLMAVGTAAAPVVKFSGILLPPLVCVMLFFRALLPGSWFVLGKDLSTYRSRFFAAGALCVCCAAAFFLIVWSAYRFHRGDVGGPTTSPDFVATVGLWAGRAGLVPHGWSEGLAIQRSLGNTWPGFFLGTRSREGWFLYFPVAWLLKTPMATILAVGIAAGIIFYRRVTSRGQTTAAEILWTAAVLVFPAVTYGGCAIASRFNAGLRHFIEIYPFVYVGAAAIWANALHWAWARRAAGGLGLLLIAETASAAPNYLAYFNWPSRAAGPVNLLADANLDWGQDLKELTDWKRNHPSTLLYVAYFGVTRPSFYGLQYIPLRGVPFIAEEGQRMPDRPCVIAVSATILQGVYSHPEDLAFFDALRKRKPLAVIGGTIYLYAYSPGDEVAPRTRGG